MSELLDKLLWSTSDSEWEDIIDELNEDEKQELFDSAEIYLNDKERDLEEVQDKLGDSDYEDEWEELDTEEDDILSDIDSLTSLIRVIEDLM
jgi:predicted phosphatase